MRNHRRLMGICCGLVVLATAACSDSTAPAAVASIDITPLSETVRSGSSVTLVATARDANGNPINDAPIAWLSSNAGVASVAGGVVLGVDNGTAQISAAAGGATASATVEVFVGVTGTWAGSLTSPSGATTCPLTQSLTESPAGGISGSGTVSAPCSAGSYTVAGNNDVGGVADSVNTTWTGPFTLTFAGSFDGGDTMSGVMGGACADCTFTFTRSSLQPAVRVAVRSYTRSTQDRFLP